jgi:hypothetical protein
MKKQNLKQIFGSRFSNLLSTAGNRIVVYAFLTVIFLPLFADAINSSPRGNVKLSGRSYLYPIGLEGDPYLFSEWSTATIRLENGQVAEGEKVKLNIITNDLIFYNEELKRIFVIDKETVKSFTINPGSSDSLFFIKYRGESVGYKLKENDFIHVLKFGVINFYVKDLADVVNATDINSKDKIYPKKYYFLERNHSTVQIALNYRAIYKYIPTKRKEIKKLITSNKLSRSSELNIIKLIGLINQEPSIRESF